LSFSGTKKRTRSKGAWATNTEFDKKSYAEFLNGTNEWEVYEILTPNGINIEMTIRNIIYRIDNDITYYYNDHRSDKMNMENCNTALLNTLVENN
jgi:hypothetical protein